MFLMVTVELREGDATTAATEFTRLSVVVPLSLVDGSLGRSVRVTDHLRSGSGRLQAKFVDGMPCSPLDTMCLAKTDSRAESL